MPGSGYDSAILTIESPQLPGGGNSTATVRVSDGKGDASKFLQQGDLVQFSTASDIIIRCIVQQATKPAGVLKSRI